MLQCIGFKYVLHPATFHLTEISPISDWVIAFAKYCHVLKTYFYLHPAYNEFALIKLP